MKERPPSFQFYPRQFSGDEHVQASDLDAIGAHILLICAAAASPEGYRLPTDERALRNRLRNPPDDAWSRIKTQLLAGLWKVSDDGRWWEQHGLRRTLEKQRAFSESQRQRVQARYSKHLPEHVPEGYRTSTDEMPEGLPGSYSSSSSSSSNQESAPKGAPPLSLLLDSGGSTAHAELSTAKAVLPVKVKRACQMPEGFTPTAEHRALASQLGVNLESAFAKFCDHHGAKGSKFLDWNKALNTWLRKEPEFGSGKAAPKPPVGSWVENEKESIRGHS